VATREDLDEPTLKLHSHQPKNALVNSGTAGCSRWVERLTLAEEALGGHCASHRPQERRARTALDHGGNPAQTPWVRSAEPEGVEDGWWISKGLSRATARPIYIYRARAGEVT